MKNIEHSPQIELTGGTLNKVTLDHRTGIVTKKFAYGNGIDLAAQDRVNGEAYSLKNIRHAPELKGVTADSILMSYIDGEHQLSDAIASYGEGRQEAVFQMAGETLSSIHNHMQIPVYDYDRKHFCKLHDLMCTTAPVLKSFGIDTNALSRFLIESYHSKEIEESGLVWTHGDYWLNNIVGVPKNGGFNLNGVIDWELAGIGSPYEDFAVVEMSIEDPHPQSSEPFWLGYGRFPDPQLKRHFAIVKTMDWMTADDNFTTDFYQKKFDMIRRSIS